MVDIYIEYYYKLKTISILLFKKIKMYDLQVSQASLIKLKTLNTIKELFQKVRKDKICQLWLVKWYHSYVIYFSAYKAV